MRNRIAVILIVAAIVGLALISPRHIQATYSLPPRVAWVTGASAGNAVGAGVTTYFGNGSNSPNATVSNRYFIAPDTGVLRNLIMDTTSSQPGDDVLTCSIVQNGTTPGALAVTVPKSQGAPFTVKDLTHSMPVSQGDLLSLQCVNHSASTSAVIGAWGVGVY